MKKRIFASLLAMVMAFSLLPLNALAANMSWKWTVTVIGGTYYRKDGMDARTREYTINRHLDNSKGHEIGYKFEWDASAGGSTYNGGWQLCLTVDGQIVERSTAYIYDKDMSTATDSWTAPGSSHTGTSSHRFQVYLSNFPKADYSKEKTFTLNYDANGGTGGPGTKTQKTSSTFVNFTVPDTVPTKQGYDFKGWSETKNGSVKYKVGDTIRVTTSTTPKTVYAVWEESEPVAEPDLSITKTTDAKDVKVGDPFDYTITVKNTGTGNASNVVVEDTLPNGLQFVSSDPSPTSQNGQKLTWTISSIAAGGSATITLKVKASEAGTYANTATISGTNKSGTTGDVEVVKPEQPPTEPNLSITKTTGAKDVKVGDPFDYTITVKNTGTGNASNVVVEDTLPNGLQFVSSDPSPASQNGQKLTWTISSIAAGASVTITLTVKAVTATSEGSDGYINTAYIEGKEENPGTAPVVPVGNALTLTKTADVKKVNVGEIFSYTLKVKNVSESDATDVVVEDVLPGSLAFYAESVKGQSGTYQFEPDAQNPQVLRWTFGTLPAGEEVTITLRVKAISAGMVKNSASIVGVTEVESKDVSIVTPNKGTLTIVKKVNHKLDEDADFTFTLKRYILSENPSGSEASYTEDTTFSHEPIVVHVAKGSDTGSATVDLPEIPVSTVYTVEEENPTSKLKMEGTTGAFSKAEYVGEMTFPNGEGGFTSTGEMQSNSFSTLWPGQEITSVTITCTNTYELTPSAKFPVTVKNSYASSTGAGTGAGDYAADETVAIRAGSRSNYKFNGWTSDSTDVTFANAKKADTTFTMPNHAVTVTASWTYTDSSHDDDDDEDMYYFAVKKVDAQDGHALNGAKFKLYLDGKQVATATSNRSGIAMFRVNESDYRKINAKSNLYYQELTAPEGYVVNSDEVSIKKINLTTSRSKAEKDAETVWNYRGTTPDLLNGDDHFAYVVGYQDGCVHPNALITRAETATIFFRLLKDSVRDGNLLTSNTYTDVPDDYWANTAISTMTGLGIVQGRSTTTFDPKAPITRAQFAAICARFDTGKSSGTQTFTDIKGHWAEKYIERAAELGWIKGFEDGTFRPDTYITRAQAMITINRVLNRIPEDASDLLPDMNVWPDCNPGDWFYLAVQEATNSHNYKHKAGNYETWTSMSKNPDWTRYEN